MQRMKKMLGTIVAAALAVTLTSCGGGGSGQGAEATAGEPTASESPEQLNVSGTLELVDVDGIDYATDGGTADECWGYGGYDDIVEGAEVVVRDADGKTVGLGELGPGSINDLRDYRCEFAFFVDGVPDEGDLFSVEVAGRGEITFRRDEASTLRVFLG